MHHLAHSVPHLDLARHIAALPQGQQLFQTGLMAVEKRQRHVAGIVLDQNLVGAPATRGRWTMGRHGHGERHRLADRRIGDRAFQLAGNAARRQVEEQVGDARRPARFTEQAVEEGRDLRPDARQRMAGAKSGSRTEGRNDIRTNDWVWKRVAR